MNWFDIVIIILVVLTLIKGFVSGFVMQIAMLAGIILGSVFAGKLSEFIAPELINLLSVSPHIMGPLSYIVAFIAILVALFFTGKAIESALKAMQINMMNRIAGAVFCSVKWLFLFSIILNLLMEFDQKGQIINEDVKKESVTYPIVSETSKLIIPYLRFDWIK